MRRRGARDQAERRRPVLLRRGDGAARAEDDSLGGLIPAPLLAGLAVEVRGESAPLDVAGWFLRGLGAEVPAVSRPAALRLTDRDDAGAAGTARLRDEPSDSPPAGLPAGTLAYATGLGLAGAGLLAVIGETSVEVSARVVEAALLLPLAMAASYGAPMPNPPAPPVPIGGGAVAADLGAPGDAEAFSRLLDTLTTGERADPDLVARRAQEWRLPVCPYRSRSAYAEPAPVVHGVGWGERVSSPVPVGLAAGGDGAPLRDTVVVDLTAMWAGPLATWLLAAAGAQVYKVEPAVRLDGMRGLDGGGIYPGGVAEPNDGARSAMFNALNRGKRRHDLDLRDGADRALFTELLGSADLLVDSFSRRVLPNLGFGPAVLAERYPALCSVSIPAFPPAAPWDVAYGTGVHAAAGLGDLGGGQFAAPVVAYPDPLGGLAAFATAVALLAGRRLGAACRRAEVPLLSATLPLLEFPADPELLARRDPTAGERLLAGPACWWEEVTDGAGTHRYPRAPFRGPDWPAVSPPAPALR